MKFDQFCSGKSAKLLHRTNKSVMLPFSANIYKTIIRGPNEGLILVILGEQGGQKLRNYLKKALI